MRLFAALTALCLFAGLALAGEHQGQVKFSDDGKKVTVKTKDGDKTFKVKSGAKVTLKFGKRTIETLEALQTAAAKSKKGLTLIVVTEGEGDKEQAVEFKNAKKKKKADTE